MRKTKRIIGAILALLLALVMLLPLTACGDKKGEDDKKPGRDPGQVEEYWVEKIEVTKGEGFQEEYADGEAFNTTGLIVKAYWNDGYIEESVPSGSYSVIPSVITEGVENVKIIYGDASQEIPISSAKIVGLAVLRAPTVSTYFVGEVFKADGMELGYLLDNGATRKIPGFDTAEVTFPDMPFAIGDREIAVTYKEYTCKVPVSVKGRGFKIEVVLESENVVMSGTEGYKEGTNAVLKKLASNGDFMQDFAIGSVMTFTFDSDTSQVNLLFQGASTYVTKYGETITYAPVIVEDMQVSRVFDMTVNGRTVPISDQAILKGKRAEDGKTENLEYLANWTEVNLGLVDVYTDKPNTVSLTFKDNGYRNQDRATGLLNGLMPAPYIDYLMISNIEEDDTVQSIEITSPPSRTTYVEGQSFDRTGMVVTATHKDGSKTTTDYYNVIPDGPLATPGENEITVAYAECTDTVKVNVIAKVMTGIEITSPPDRTTYGLNQSFDPTGMVVKAKFNDGSSQVIADYDYAPNGVLTSADKTITVTYNGFTDTVEIEVTNEDLMNYLIVGGVPTTALVEGDDIPAIDPATLTVTAKYFSGKEEPLTADRYTVKVPEGQAAIGSAVVVTLKENPEIFKTVLLNVSKQINIGDSAVSGPKNYRTDVAWAPGAYENDFVQNCSKGSVVTFRVTAETEGYAKLVLTGASGLVTKYDGTPLHMGEMKANVMFDLEVNGNIVPVADGAAFAGKEFTTPSNNNLANWSDADLGNVLLQKGDNEIKLVFKSYSYKNENGTDATPSLDYLTVTSVN